MAAKKRVTRSVSAKKVVRQQTISPANPSQSDTSRTDPPFDPVTDYAQKVVRKEIIAGPLVRLAAERHLDDLKVGASRGLRWDLEAALTAINFFPDVLRLAEGEFAGEPFNLQPWQKFVVGCLFGWKGEDGFRRFRMAYVEIAKGNGKTPLAAGIALYMLTADGEESAQVYAAAAGRDQANLQFQDAVAMVESSPELSKRILKSGKKKVFNLAHLRSHSFYRPISSEGRLLDGKRVHYAGLDEVHEHPNDTVVEKMRAGTKGRRQALILLITNSGFNRETVCWSYHSLSKMVLERTKEMDHLFAFVCCLDEKDDWRDEAVWAKANPNLDVSVTRKYLREQVAEAVDVPSKQNIVRRLNFCEWTEADNAWITKDRWDAVVGEIDREDLVGRPCKGALDLSLRKDLTSKTLIFRVEEGEDLSQKYLKGKEGVIAITTFWTPKDTMKAREIKDGVSYTKWEEDGHLIGTPGKVVDYSHVAKSLAEDAELYDLGDVAFDEYRIEALQKELDEENVASIKLVKHPQGFRRNSDNELWMPESINKLEERILAETIMIETNPVMRWCAASAVFDQSAEGNRKFNKRKATGRIDGVVTLAMSVGIDATEPKSEKPTEISSDYAVT